MSAPPREVSIPKFMSALILCLALSMTALMKQCYDDAERKSVGNQMNSKVLAQGLHVQGHVIGKKRESKYISAGSRVYYSHFLTVEFQTKSGKTVQGTRQITTLPSGEIAKRTQIGDSVDVYYLPGRENEFVLPRFISDEDTTPHLGIVVLILGGSLLLGVVGIGGLLLRMEIVKAKYWTLVDGKVLSANNDEMTYEYSIQGRSYTETCGRRPYDRSSNKVLVLVNPEDAKESFIYSNQNLVRIRGL